MMERKKRNHPYIYIFRWNNKLSQDYWENPNLWLGLETGNQNIYQLSKYIQLSTEHRYKWRYVFWKIFTIKWSLIRCLKGSDKRNILHDDILRNVIRNNDESSNFYFSLLPPLPPLLSPNFQTKNTICS